MISVLRVKESEREIQCLHYYLAHLISQASNQYSFYLSLLSDKAKIILSQLNLWCQNFHLTQLSDQKHFKDSNLSRSIVHLVLSDSQNNSVDMQFKK